MSSYKNFPSTQIPKIFITGHRGYIGSALYRKLKPKFYVKGYDIIDGFDIMDYQLLVSTMKSFNPDIVIHLAALSSVTACNEDIHKAIMYNAIGTKNVLDAMIESRCNNIIYASTSSVYGDNSYYTKNPFTEYSLLRPCSPYGLSKLLGEHIIYNHFNNKGLTGNYFIYRMFNVVGNYGTKNTASACDRLFAALKSGNVIIYGNTYPTFDGTCERDYISLMDVCNAFTKGIEILISQHQKQEILNICTGHSWSVKSLVNKWNKISEHHSVIDNVKFCYGPKREGDPAIVYGSNRKAKNILDWKPSQKMEDIILSLAYK